MTSVVTVPAMTAEDTSRAPFTAAMDGDSPRSRARR